MLILLVFLLGIAFLLRENLGDVLKLAGIIVGVMLAIMVPFIILNFLFSILR